MSLILAMVTYWIMAIILILGVVFAVKGSFALLILGSLAFIFILTKTGILPHS
jgi:hypothetical protein